MKNRSLKWRIVLPVALMLVVGISAIVAIVGVNFSRAMTHEVNQTLEEMAFNYANRIKADMELSLGGVMTLSPRSSTRRREPPGPIGSITPS